MFDREKLFHLLTDANNPAWKWLPNNGETLKLVDKGKVTYEKGKTMKVFSYKYFEVDPSMMIVAEQMAGLKKFLKSTFIAIGAKLSYLNIPFGK